MSGRLREFFIPPLAAGFIRGLKSTLRLEWRGREIVEKLRAEKRPYIHAFWHGRLLLMPYSYLGDRITILISKHGDGELIARTMRRFGHETTRGSTSTGSVEAFKALVRAAREGYDIGYTPDGPRGPRYSSTAGPIQLARMTGLPIVPVTCSARKKKLGSWDNFLLPFPFTKAVFAYGAPLEIPRKLDDAEVETWRLRLERELGLLTAQLDAELGDPSTLEELRARGILNAS